MNHLARLCLLLGVIATPAAAVTVEAASGDWSKLPKLSQRGYDHLDEKMQAKLYEIAASKQCPAFGLKQDRLDLTVTFAVQYRPDGALDRLVLPRLDCAQAEGVIGGALLAMLEAKDYAPTGQSPSGWYQGALGFAFAGNAARDPGVSRSKDAQAVAKLDPNEVVCEKSEVIGTRLSNSRTCMSRAQWAEQRRLSRQVVEQAQRTRCQEQDNSC